MHPAELLPPKGVWQLQSTLHAFSQPCVLLPENIEDTAVPLAGVYGRGCDKVHIKGQADK